MFVSSLSLFFGARTPCSAWLPAATRRISTGTSQHYARSQAGPALLRAGRIYSWFPPAIYRAPGSSLRCHDGLFNAFFRFSEIEVNRNLAKILKTKYIQYLSIYSRNYFCLKTDDFMNS
jgi:hypothetical protein